MWSWRQLWRCLWQPQLVEHSCLTHSIVQFRSCPPFVLITFCPKGMNISLHLPILPARLEHQCLGIQMSHHHWFPCRTVTRTLLVCTRETCFMSWNMELEGKQQRLYCFFCLTCCISIFRVKQKIYPTDSAVVSLCSNFGARLTRKRHLWRTSQKQICILTSSDHFHTWVAKVQIAPWFWCG